MSKIIKILDFSNKKKYAIVNVLLDDGTEASVYIGGLVEVWFDPDWGKIKAFVKKA